MPTEAFQQCTAEDPRMPLAPSSSVPFLPRCKQVPSSSVLAIPPVPSAPSSNLTYFNAASQDLPAVSLVPPPMQTRAFRQCAVLSPDANGGLSVPQKIPRCHLRLSAVRGPSPDANRYLPIVYLALSLDAPRRLLAMRRLKSPDASLSAGVFRTTRSPLPSSSISCSDGR